MFFADYHTHSRFSSDGREGIEALLEQARFVGLQELCLTDHCDMLDPFDDEGYERWFRAAQRANRTGVRLRYGVELGEAIFRAEEAQRILDRHDYDLVIGSQHLSANGEDFYYISYHSQEQCIALLDGYMTLLLELAALDSYDVLGHLTYPLRYMSGREGFDIDFFDRYETELIRLFELLVTRGKGIEVNVSGLYRGEWNHTMPGSDIVALYRRCGGEIVTVGSDAHKAAYIGCGVEQGLEICRAAGFTHVAAYEERRPRFEKI